MNDTASRSNFTAAGSNYRSRYQRKNHRTSLSLTPRVQNFVDLHIRSKIGQLMKKNPAEICKTKPDGDGCIILPYLLTLPINAMAHVLFLIASLSSFLLVSLVPASNAALLSVNPKLELPPSLSSIGVTSSATNIFVNITGAGNLNQVQQQLLVASLLGGLNSGLGAPGAGGLGYQYGLNVGDYLGITGPAAAAATAYTNPLGIYPPSASSGSYLPLQSLGSGLYPGYSNLVAGAPPSLGGGGGLGSYGSSPYGLGGGSALGAYLQSRSVSSVFLPT